MDMSEAVAERVKQYVLDGSDQDLKRILSISQVSADMARAAFHRIGVQKGWSAIDCGCSPIGDCARTAADTAAAIAP
jgi:hypothetical protein